MGVYIYLYIREWRFTKHYYAAHGATVPDFFLVEAGFVFISATSVVRALLETFVASDRKNGPLKGRINSAAHNDASKNCGSVIVFFYAPVQVEGT